MEICGSEGRMCFFVFFGVFFSWLMCFGVVVNYADAVAVTL